MKDRWVGALVLVTAFAILAAVACQPTSPPPTSTTTSTTTTAPCTPPTTVTDTTTTTVEDTTTTTVEDTTTTTVEDTTTTVEDTTTTVEDTTTTVEDTTTTTVEDTTTTTLPECAPTTTTTEPEPTTTTTAEPTTTTTLPVDRPNILVVMTDDQGCDQHTTRLCDMVEAAMPFLASEPGGRWYVANQARTHNSVCCPNRASILTGQTNLHNGVLSNSNCKKFSDIEYLPVALQRAGYNTGHFGKFLNCFPGGSWVQLADGTWVVPRGWDRFIGHLGAPNYYNFDVIDNGVSYTVSDIGPTSYEPYWFKDRLIEWLDAQPQGEPWFAYYTPYGPHAPGTSAPDWNETLTRAVPNLPNFREGCPGATDPSIADKPSFIQSRSCAGDRGNGKGAQYGVDRAFQAIYQYLATSGQLDDTVILFMSDNGMALGSHRVTAKTCAYEECHTIPFMIRVPGFEGGTIDRMVSNLDVTPTLLHLAGAATTRPQDGSSIVPLLTGAATSWRSDQIFWNAQEKYRAIRQDCIVNDPCWFYTEYENGERELYDLRADPFQLNQLLPNSITGFAGDPAWQDPANPIVAGLASRTQTAFVAAGGTKWP